MQKKVAAFIMLCCLFIMSNNVSAAAFTKDMMLRVLFMLKRSIML